MSHCSVLQSQLYFAALLECRQKVLPSLPDCENIVVLCSAVHVVGLSESCRHECRRELHVLHSPLLREIAHHWWQQQEYYIFQQILRRLAHKSFRRLCQRDRFRDRNDLEKVSSNIASMQ